MKYQIKGADKNTGVDVVVEIDAETREQALHIAASKGILVSEIIPPALDYAKVRYTHNALINTGRAIRVGAITLFILIMAEQMMDGQREMYEHMSDSVRTPNELLIQKLDEQSEHQNGSSWLMFWAGCFMASFPISALGKVLKGTEG